MSDFGKLLEGIHERRIKAGYREPGPPRERMPPDHIEPCIRYPTVALVAFLATVGVVFACVALMIWLIVTTNRIPKPGATPKTIPGRAAVSASQW